MQINTRESYEVLVVDIEGRLDTNTSGYGYDEMVRQLDRHTSILASGFVIRGKAW